MALLEEAKALIHDPEIQEGTKDFLSDLISGFGGDKFALAKIIVSLAKSPAFFREKLFWLKFTRFLTGIEVNDIDRPEFYRKLTDDKKKEDNVCRLFQIIDHVETVSKMDFVINASRALIAEYINPTTYFRICNTIRDVLEEDLIFLRDHIGRENNFEYSDAIQGLLNMGLVYRSVVGEEAKFSFTPFADTLNKYSLSLNGTKYDSTFDGVNRICNHTLYQSIPSLEWIDF